MQTVADIFISYSRQDSLFVEELRAALKSQGRSVWLDTSDIAPTSLWRHDITEAIDAASAVLFVLSPAWLGSEVSQRELQYAVEAHKKLVPVLYQDVDHAQVHPALAEINWILARPGDNWQDAVQRILFAVDTDLEYWQQGGDLAAKASQWSDHKRQPAYTLRGEALRQAEQWMTQGASKRPAPSQLQIEYITAGRRAAAARQRTTIGALSAGIIVTLILAIVASTLAFMLKAQNWQLGWEVVANEGRAQVAGDHPDLGLLLAAAAYKEGTPGDSATRNALFTLVHQSPHLGAILQNAAGSTAGTDNFIEYSADGNTTAYVGISTVTIKFTGSSRAPVTISVPYQGGYPGIIGASLSLDGSRIALKTQSSNSPASVTLWNAKSGMKIRQLDGVTYEPQPLQHNLAFSPDGRLIASAMCPDTACNTTEFTIWNADTGKIVTQIPGLYPIDNDFGDSVSFSGDDRYVAFSETESSGSLTSPARVVVVDLRQNAPSFILSNTPAISTVAFVPASDVLAVASQIESGDQVTFWNVVSQAQVGKVPLISGLHPITTIEFNRQGYWMLTSDNIKAVQLWFLASDYSTVQLNENVVNVEGRLRAVALSPDGTTVTTSSNDSLDRVWRLAPFTSASPNAIFSLGARPQLAFTPDSTSLLFTTAYQTVDSWNILHGTPGPSVTIPTNDPPFQMAESADGTTLALALDSGSSAGVTLAIFNRATGILEGSPWPGVITATTILQISPDGKTLLACGILGADVSVCLLWDTASQSIIQTFPSLNSKEPDIFTAGSFSPDGTSIAFGVLHPAGNNTRSEIEVYDVARDQFTKSLLIQGAAGQILSALGWSPDGRYVGYLDTVGYVAVWDPSSNAQPIPVTQLAGAVLPSFQFMVAPPDTAPHSLWIMTGDEAGVGIWQVDPQARSTTSYIDPLSFENLLSSAVVSPNGRYLAVGEQDVGLISVISLDPNDWLRQACSIAGRNLTKHEWQTYVQGTPALSGAPYVTLCPGPPT